MPKQNKSNDQDALMMEYNLALEEHKIVNAQILHFHEANAKVYEFGLIALGAVVVAAAYVIEQKAYYLLLVLSIPFHILMWLQTRRGIISVHLANHIIHNIAPRIRKIINQSYGGSQKIDFIFWEEYSAKASKNKKTLGLVLGLSEFGSVIYQISISATLIILYFLLKSSDSKYINSGLDTALLVINGIAIAASIFGIIVASVFFEDSRKKT